MSINIINKTSYEQVEIVYGGTVTSLKKDKSISFEALCDKPKIEVLVLQKNEVLLNLLFALVDGFIDGESVVNSLVCNVSFNVCSNDNSQTIIIEDLEYRDDKNGYIYESVNIKGNNIENISYYLRDTDNARKKANFYYVFIVSWLPVIIALLSYYFFVRKVLLLVIASLLILFVFAIPSWKKANNTKKYYNSEFANIFLKKEAIKRNLNENIHDTPNDFLGKTVYKALDYFFKKK